MAEQARRLTESEIAEALATLPDWTVENGKLHRQYQFKNFVEAFGFMTSAALVAESMNHHPEWFNVYHKVVVDLLTHSVGAISNFDFDLARMMETLAQRSANH
jgi:4a-hydroxytetrahydrobiopterin dehydratase